MAEGGSSKQNVFSVQQVHAKNVHFVVQEEQMREMGISMSGKSKNQQAKESQAESDGAAVFETADGSFSRQLPQSEKEDMKKLSDTVFMFTKKPLYPGTRVYQGQQRHLGGRFRELAIKVLPRNETTDQEAGLLLSIEHPNIVRVIETGHFFGTGPESYIAMELCSKNLQEYVNENQQKPFNFDEAFSFSKQLISAVAYIHKNKIIHLDLKPGNILISMCGTQIKVADMGFSKDVSSQSAAYVTNISAGSEGFKAPETFTNTSVYTYSADIFPLGIIVYFIFTNGKHPFGSKPHRWATNIEDNRDRDLSQIAAFKKPNTAKRPQLVETIERMLEPDPTKRPTAEQLLKNEFFTDINQSMPVTSQIATMAVSSQSQVELEKPLKEIGYEKSSEILERQTLRGTSDLKILLQLAECYLHLMSDKKDSSIANVAQFIITSGSRSASDVRKMAYDLKQQGHYVQAMILYKICHDLHKTENKLTPDEELKWTSNRIIDIKCAIEPLVKEGGRSRDIANLYGLEYMAAMLTEVLALKNASPDVKALNELTCIVNMTAIYCEVGEYGKSIQLGEAGTTMAKRQIKGNISNYKGYGRLMNNLGIAYHNSGQYSKAKHCYITAIEVCKRALDYENEKERQECIESTKTHLKSTRIRLANQK